MPRRSIVELVLPEPAGFSACARLLEAAATRASTEAGYPPEWYDAEGTAWVIRRSTIERTAEIVPGTAIVVTTWVGDFRRVRSRREYKGRVRGELVLRARTDWVYVERAAGKPRRIPEAMMRAFVPEGDVEAASRDALDVGDPPADAVSAEWVVDPADVDALSHVNNAKYFDYVEGVARAALGAAQSELRPSRHDVEYLDEAVSGDRLRGAAWRSKSSGDTVETATELRRARDGAVLTRAQTTWRR